MSKQTKALMGDGGREGRERRRDRREARGAWRREDRRAGR
jgi:hypothetical protein